MVRRAQSHGTTTKAPSSGSRNRNKTSKRPAASSRTEHAQERFQEPRADCFGPNFAVLKPGAVDGVHSLEIIEGNETRQRPSRTPLPEWLADTCALLPKTHPLRKLARVRPPSPNVVGERDRLDAFSVFPLASSEMDHQTPFRPHTSLSSHQTQAPEAPAFYRGSPTIYMEDSLREAPPSTWPFRWPGPGVRYATAETSGRATPSSMSNAKRCSSTHCLSPLPSLDDLGVEFESLDHSPVVSDYTSSTFSTHLEIPTLRRNSPPYWRNTSRSALPPPHLNASQVPVLLSPSSSRLETPLKEGTASAIPISLMNVDLLPSYEENDNEQDDCSPIPLDGSIVPAELEPGIERRDLASHPGLTGLNLRHTGSSPFRAAPASLNRIRGRTPIGRLLSPFLPMTESHRYMTSTPSLQRQDTIFIPFRTPLKRSSADFDWSRRTPQAGRNSGVAMNDRYTEDIIAYAASINPTETLISPAGPSLFQPSEAQRDQHPPFEWQWHAPQPSYTEQERVEGANHPSLESINKTLQGSSPWFSRLGTCSPADTSMEQEERHWVFEPDGDEPMRAPSEIEEL
ncbi:hypothetical protein FRB90_008856 [Tulasnella sp. 427]|nr:hypothetical protein FRB90_008856 [Tulasnella sp. 427]